MAVDAATTVVAAATGAIVGGIFTILNLWITKRSDERRQIRELAVKVALENWKTYLDVSPKGSAILPIDVYLIHATHLVAALDGRLAKEDDIKKHIKDSLMASETAIKVVEDYNDFMKEKRRQTIEQHKQKPGEP